MSPQDDERRRYAGDGLLRDGGSIHVRAIRSDDKDRLLEHFGNLKPRSVYFRFLAAKPRLTTAELRFMTELDFVERVGLVATLRDGDRESIIGAGFYFARTDQQAPHRAEVAFAVVDAHQRRGIGTLLLEHLAGIARAAGITEFEADVLGENNRMLEVFDKSGFRVSRSIEAGVFHISFPTAETDEYSEAVRAREREAEAQSVRAILEPRAVAVVGASRRAGTIGAALVHNLQTGGFAGPIYLVNPHATEIAGLRAYPSVSSIGAPVDLAIIAVPAGAVENVARDCAHAGVRGVVVISAGFAETSPAGLEAQQRLLALVRASGMRMIGPNCMGVLNTDPAVALNATVAPTVPAAGNVAILSQSGGLGFPILDKAHSLDIGLSSFVSLGNTADVSGNDLLSYWLEDPRTAVVVLYPESLGNPRKFVRLALAVARTKPIVAIAPGRSVAGRRAGSSRPAALAGLDVAVDALFEQAGVIRTDTLAQLFDVVALLATQPAPLGPRVGVVTNAGGPAILLADACEAHGLALPEIAPATQEALRAFLPATANVANPVDLIASATPEQYARALEIVGNDPSIDAVVAIYVPVVRATSEDIAAAIARAAGAVPTRKPVLTVCMAWRGGPALLGAGPRGRLPCYSFPENAALALAAAERYGRWRQRPSGVPLVLTHFGQSAIRAVVDRVLTDAAGPCWLDMNDVATVLRAVGIAVAVAEETSLAGAEAVAERIGYPLVAKVMHGDGLQKSDVGGAITGLESAGAVRAAVLTLAARMAAGGRTLERVLLQREKRGGIEALIGVTSDPRFGPLLVLGYGGVLVELLRDVSCRLLPVTDVDAAEMIGKLRASALLDGYRGAAPGDRAALASALMRVSALAEIVPELRELDLNPVKVLAPGDGVVVVDARMCIAPL